MISFVKRGRVRETEAPEVIAVVQVKCGSVIYCGRNVAAAAFCLIPGTCFGKGPDESSAIRTARVKAEGFRLSQSQAAA